MERTITKTTTETLRVLFVSNPTDTEYGYDFGGHSYRLAPFAERVEMPEARAQHVLGLFQNVGVSVSDWPTQAMEEEVRAEADAEKAAPKVDTAEAEREAKADPPPVE